MSEPAHRGVCPPCLDEDAEEGRDHYCRRSWACVEAVVCFRHKSALRLTVVGVSAAICFNSGRHPPAPPDCFTVITMRSSPHGGSSDAIKQSCCRSYRRLAKPSARAGRSLNVSRRQAASSGRRGRKACYTLPRWVYRCLTVNDRRSQ